MLDLTNKLKNNYRRVQLALAMKDKKKNNENIEESKRNENVDINGPSNLGSKASP